MSLSVVIPCYNEAEIIESVIRSFHKEIIDKEKCSEFIIVDDCSTDNTAEILNQLKTELENIRILKTDKNSGHGKAIRLGYDNAKYDYVFQVDGDNQFNAEDFGKFYDNKDKSDFILGYRVNRNDPVSRLLLTNMLRWLIAAIFDIHIKDINCPFRLIKKERLNELLKEIDVDTLTPNIILSILAKKRGLKFTELAVSHNKRQTGHVFGFSWKLIKFSAIAFFQVLRVR